MEDKEIGDSEKWEGVNKEAENEVLRLEYEKSQRRLKEQLNTFREFSREGLRIFRLLLLLIGAPVAILGALSPTSILELAGILTSNQCAISSSIGCLPVGFVSIVTGFFLLLTMILNISASGYEAHGVRNITNPTDIDNVLNEPDMSSFEYYKDRLEKYRSRIRHNDRIISAEEKLLAVGKFTLTLTLLGVGTLAFVIIGDTTISIIYWSIAVVVLYIPAFLLTQNLPKVYSKQDTIWNRGSLIYDRPENNLESEEE